VAEGPAEGGRWPYPPRARHVRLEYTSDPVLPDGPPGRTTRVRDADRTRRELSHRSRLRHASAPLRSVRRLVRRLEADVKVGRMRTHRILSPTQLQPHHSRGRVPLCELAQLSVISRGPGLAVVTRSFRHVMPLRVGRGEPARPFFTSVAPSGRYLVRCATVALQALQLVRPRSSVPPAMRGSQFPQAGVAQRESHVCNYSYNHGRPDVGQSRGDASLPTSSRSPSFRF
jgi:hypothetical protein